jgi:hypothetical protein
VSTAPHPHPHSHPHSLPAAVRVLRDPATIRARCAEITAGVAAGKSRWFAIDDSRLPATADFVAEVTRRSYPDLNVPFHSRWRHFEVGGVDRVTQLRLRLADRDADETARTLIDLAVVSVLLDAGAGAQWRWQSADGQSHFRSEGLALASLQGFIEGAFSSAAAQPLRVDAQALGNFGVSELATLFQVRPDNPLVGLEGRAELLQRLGRALAGRRDVFGAEARPGMLYDTLTDHGRRRSVSAAEILMLLLDTLSGIWLTPSRIDGVALGDVWQHPLAGGSGATAHWVPFHKLSQWLCYSLLEPLQWAGVRVTGLDALTALPEYRNGGLLIDTGWLQPSAALLAGAAWQPGDEAIVEWRALTVTLIDRLAQSLRERLGVDARQLPLAALLQGGTWSAGRRLAAERRGGRPPIAVCSDGTVF